MPKQTEEQKDLLHAVTAARLASKGVKEELRAHFDRLYEAEAKKVDASVDLAVREAADGDCKIAWIQQAYDTRDFNTIKRILERTPSLVAVKEEIAAEDRYGYTEDGDYLVVRYSDYGPEKISGEASFVVIALDDEGEFMLDAATEPNAVTRALDGVLEGFYYDDAVKWIRSH